MIMMQGSAVVVNQHYDHDARILSCWYINTMIMMQGLAVLVNQHYGHEAKGKTRRVILTPFEACRIY